MGTASKSWLSVSGAMAAWMVLVPFLPAASGQQQAREDDAGREEKKPAAERSPTHDEAVAILRKVDEATKAVTGVRYNGTFTASGLGAAQLPVIKGKAEFAGALAGGTHAMYLDVIVTPPTATEGRRLTLGGAVASGFYLIDWDKKIVYESDNPQMFGMDGQRAQAIKIIEFVHPTPFTQEIEGEYLEVKDPAEVNGVACHVIHVVYGIGGQEATWYVSKEDYLPRRVTRSFPTQRGERAFRDYTIADLEVDPEFSAERFKLTVPEGFERTDEISPSFNWPR